MRLLFITGLSLIKAAVVKFDNLLNKVFEKTSQKIEAAASNTASLVLSTIKRQLQNIISEAQCMKLEISTSFETSLVLNACGS